MNAMAHDGVALAAAGVGFSSSIVIGAAAPLCDTGAFFTPAFSMVGGVGRLKSLPVPMPGLLTQHCPPPPRLAANVAVSHCIGVPL